MKTCNVFYAYTIAKPGGWLVFAEKWFSSVQGNTEVRTDAAGFKYYVFNGARLMLTPEEPTASARDCLFFESDDEVKAWAKQSTDSFVRDFDFENGYAKVRDPAKKYKRVSIDLIVDADSKAYSDVLNAARSNGSIIEWGVASIVPDITEAQAQSVITHDLKSRLKLSE
jgi:hypothetical protein